MSYTNGLDKPSDYFNTKLYTGNGGTQSITGVGFQPDFTWIKRRDGTAFHVVTDSVRGATKQIYPNDTQAEGTRAQGLQSFNTDGYTLGNEGDTNANSSSMASWNWKAGTSFTNDASATGIGSIDSTGSVNTDAGFSIVSYTGTGSAGTIKHGLSTAPSMIILKNRSAAEHWMVGTTALGWTKNLVLSLNNAVATDGSVWNNTAPTSSVFSVGNSGAVNTSSQNYIAYCFAEKQGYSKFGSYTGNGNADGTFVYLGFKPAFVMVKRTDAAENWYMKDNKRDIFNPVDNALYANSSAAELTDWGGATTDYLSNGFKLKTTDSAHNASGGTYIYMAFASEPFTTSTGVCATAR